MNIKIADLAYGDIEQLFQYSIETFGEARTLQYLDTLFAKIDRLTKMSEIGRLLKPNESAMRIINVEKHVVIYQVNEGNDEVVVLRIVHQKINMDDLID